MPPQYRLSALRPALVCGAWRAPEAAGYLRCWSATRRPVRRIERGKSTRPCKQHACTSCGCCPGTFQRRAAVNPQVCAFYFLTAPYQSDVQKSPPAPRSSRQRRLFGGRRSKAWQTAGLGGVVTNVQPGVVQQGGYSGEGGCQLRLESTWRGALVSLALPGTATPSQACPCDLRFAMHAACHAIV